MPDKEKFKEMKDELSFYRYTVMWLVLLMFLSFVEIGIADLDYGYYVVLFAVVMLVNAIFLVVVFAVGLLFVLVMKKMAKLSHQKRQKRRPTTRRTIRR